jgi:G:T-mismatch repair DNA endonuclease (very short patch repair protein)
MNIIHSPQHIIGDKFVVDEFLPNHNIVIEAWGDFWHANPRRFSKNKLTEIQKKNVAKDDSRLKYLKACGYIVITLWGYDLKNNITKCQETIQNTILLADQQ